MNRPWPKPIYELHLIPQKALVIMHSRFDGQIVMVSLTDFQMVDTIINRFPALDDRIESITTSVNKAPGHIAAYSLFYNLIVEDDHLLSISAKRFPNGLRTDRFAYPRSTGQGIQGRITFKDFPMGVRFIKKLGSIYVIIDKDGQLYTTSKLPR